MDYKDKVIKLLMSKELTEEQKSKLLDIFPELKESEDERIREALIKFMERFPYDRLENDGVSVKEAIAWLEKQGEQKPADKVEPKFKVGQTIKKEGFNLGFTIVKIEDGFYYNDMGDNFPFTDQDNWELVEQKPTELPKGEDYGIDGLYAAVDILQKTLGNVEGYQTDDGILEHKCAVSAVKKLYEQKPAWSEEDERKLKTVISLMKSNRAVNPFYDKMCLEHWLKSLKDRIQPQPKQEWSEEDKYTLECLIDYLETELDNSYLDEDKETFAKEIKLLEYIKDRGIPLLSWNQEDKKLQEALIKLLSILYENDDYMTKVGIDVGVFKNWLKSLRPQNRWNPSEEQMSALSKAIAFVFDSNSDVKHSLESLYNELKKL